MVQELIDKLQNIGRKGFCTQEELAFFLPNGTPRGQESIFNLKINTINSKPTELLVDIIKGYHIVERAHSNSEFGFGSPSQVYNFINYLMKKDPIKGEEIYNWVASNGGNYYIHEGETYKERINREQMAQERRIKILEADKKTSEENRRKRAEVHKARVERFRKQYFCPKCYHRVTRVPISDYIEDGQSPHSGRAQCTNCGWKSEYGGYGILCVDA